MTNSTSSTSKIHWNYFLALERDLEIASRYVEFVAANMATYSIEFAHLLFAAASEVDVVAKLLCKQLVPNAPRQNIDHYRTALASQIPDLAATQVQIPRYALTLTPWNSWSNGQNPTWWRCYNNVKHQRDTHYPEATLENAINALAGLMTLTFYHYGHVQTQPGSTLDKKEVTRNLLPDSSLLRFPDTYYYDTLIV